MFKGFQKSTSIKNSKESQESTSVNQEKALIQLGQQKSYLEKNIEEYCQRLEQLDRVCKGHISAGRQIAAKGCIKEMQSLRKQIEMNHQKINILIKMMIEIEIIFSDQDLGNLMEQATSLFRSQEELNNQLNDNLLTWQEVQESFKLRDNLFQEMEEQYINNQEIDDTLNQYEEEMKSEQLMQQFDNVSKQKIQSIKINQSIKHMQVTSAKRDLLFN